MQAKWMKESDNSQRARGATFGALIMAGFGSIWLALGLTSAGVSLRLVAALVAPLYAALWAASVVILNRLPMPELVAVEDPEQRRRSRFFAMVNVAQGVAIFLTINVLANLHLAAWEAPAVVLIVGLHFLPLARLFQAPAHWVTGLAMVACALAAPFLPTAARTVTECLAAGMILWVSAGRAVVMAFCLAGSRAPRSMLRVQA